MLHKFSEVYSSFKISKTRKLSWDKNVLEAALKEVENMPSTRRCEMHEESHSPKDLSIWGYSYMVNSSEYWLAPFRNKGEVQT